MSRHLKRLSINKHRLEDNEQERKTLGWLNKRTISSNQTNLEVLKDSILCMNMYGEGYTYLDDKQKELVGKLQQNEKIVEITIATIFQWFGSCVGHCAINSEIKD